MYSCSCYTISIQIYIQITHGNRVFHYLILNLRGPAKFKLLKNLFLSYSLSTESQNKKEAKRLHQTFTHSIFLLIRCCICEILLNGYNRHTLPSFHRMSFASTVVVIAVVVFRHDNV